MDMEAEIVETTFRSRFRFRFLKYPLSKKSRFFSGTRNIFVSGNVWERKKETKLKETETSRNRPKFWERKSRFHYLCITP